MKMLLSALLLGLMALTAPKMVEPQKAIPKVAAAPSLQYLVRMPTIPSEKPPLLLLLHGLGSNEQDLFSLAAHLPGNFLVISARAPYTVGPNSYRWYDLKFVDGKPVGNAEETEKSGLLLLQFIEELKEKEKFDAEQVYFCGFSQGAIMSYHVGLRNPDKVKGIIALSGRLLDETKASLASAEALKNFRALIVHGTADRVLPINYGREAKAALEKLGFSLSYKEFDIGHSINAEILALINTWLITK